MFNRCLANRTLIELYGPICSINGTDRENGCGFTSAFAYNVDLKQG
ncbi:hypothetical protein [Shouchella lehensis]|nr:hypothetical protein [Shouchella lehensis]